MTLLLTCPDCAGLPCVRACPMQAISPAAETAGTVEVAMDLCIGCGCCTTACPFARFAVDPARGKAVASR